VGGQAAMILLYKDHQIISKIQQSTSKTPPKALYINNLKSGGYKVLSLLKCGSIKQVADGVFFEARSLSFGAS